MAQEQEIRQNIYKPSRETVGAESMWEREQESAMCVAMEPCKESALERKWPSEGESLREFR